MMFCLQISNVLFLVFPPILFQLFHQYGKFVSRGIYLVWFLFLIVGISSAYFHATLSLLGQLLDELSILWLVATGFALWFPRRLLPTYFNGSRCGEYHIFIHFFPILFI
jgi:alkaline ceramidase